MVPLRILLLEDDDNDAFLVRRALSSLGDKVTLARVHNGGEAIQYLQGRGEFADREKYPFPTLIVTDLKMPLIDGLEFLRWVKNHPICKPLPVVMLSASGTPKDVQQAYRLGVTAYFVKPVQFQELVRLLLLTHEYWRQAEQVEASECP